MDQFDRAQELDAMYRNQAIEIWEQGARQQSTASNKYCEDCETEIPEERRLAVPGCRRCRTCQQKWEQQSG